MCVQIAPPNHYKNLLDAGKLEFHKVPNEINTSYTYSAGPDKKVVTVSHIALRALAESLQEAGVEVQWAFNLRKIQPTFPEYGESSFACINLMIADENQLVTITATVLKKQKEEGKGK